MVVVRDGRALISQADFGRQFKYPRSTVDKAVQDGRLDAALVEMEGRKRPMLDMGEAVWIMEGGEKMKSHRERKDKYDGLLKQLEYEERAGQLMQSRSVAKAVVEIASHANMAWENLADRISGQLSAMDDEIKINQLLTKEVDKIRLEYVTNMEALAAGEGDG